MKASICPRLASLQGHAADGRTGDSADDMDAMFERAQKAQVKSMIITGTSLAESRAAVRLAKEKGES